MTQEEMDIVAEEAKRGLMNKPWEAMIYASTQGAKFEKAFNKLVAEKGYASFEDVYKELGWESPFKKNVFTSPESLEDTVDEAKDKAMRDIAWKVHCMISEGKSIVEIDHYVCGICDF